MGKTTTRKSRRPNNVDIRTSLPAAIFGLVLVYTITHPPGTYAALVPSEQPNTFADLEPIVGNIISVSVALAGIAAFVMLLLGGIQYLSSGGDPKATQQARNTITYGIVGLALLILAWFALVFIEQFTGVKVTIFTVPAP